MSRLCPLYSGSTGNSTYIGTEKGGILIDAGASMKGICRALERAGGDYREIAAVFVTHEHSDHIKGLSVFLKSTGVALAASSKTLEALANSGKIPAGIKTIAADEGDTEICGITVKRFATSHDCEGSSGYVLCLPDGKRAAVCTDLGVMTDEVRNAVSGCDTVLIESNHDIEMLKKGPYPPQLKMRILSEKGHLSNYACASELCGLLKSGTAHFLLGHLSGHNNLPMLAQKAAEDALIDIGALNGRDYTLSVASPERNGVTVF